MALTNCHECGGNVSTEAAACPNCGAKPKPAKKEPKHIGTGQGLLLIIGAIVVFAWLGSSGSGSTSSTPQLSDADCRKDLQCWGDRGSVAAGIYCAPKVEKLALHSVRWTDGALEPKFSRFRWKDKDAGIVTFIGDKAEFQNGFGAFTPVVYECDLDADQKTVLDVRANEGRLP